MHKQKAPIYMLSRSKASKTQQMRVTNIREKPVDFFGGTKRVVTLANLGSFAKASVSV